MFSRCVLHLRNPQLDCVWINLVIFGYIFTYHTSKTSKLDYFFNWFGDIFTYFHLKSILDLIVLEIIWCCGRGQQKPQVVLPRQSTKKKSICSFFLLYLFLKLCICICAPQTINKEEKYLFPFFYLYLSFWRCVFAPQTINKEEFNLFVPNVFVLFEVFICVSCSFGARQIGLYSDEEGGGGGGVWWDSCLLGKLSCLVLSPCC